MRRSPRDALRIVSPNITLYPVWEGEVGVSPVKLICTLSGFFPKQLTVEWRQNGQSPAGVRAKERNLQSADGEEATFTLTSEIEPDMEEWTTGSSFTCSSVHNQTTYEETISICQIHKSCHPSIHVDVPTFRTVTTQPDVQVTCFIRNVFKAELTWETDGSSPPGDKVQQETNATFSISHLKVPSSAWKNLKVLKCKAEHRCFSAEKVLHVSGPAVTPPQVEIRRSLPDLLKGDAAVLQCHVSQLSSQDLYVTFQIEGADVAGRQYVDLPEGPGPHSLSRSFSVPQEFWTNESSFSCSVTQGFSRSSFKSNSISHVFVEPSVELLLIPGEESSTQGLLCSGRGFDPQIKWFSDSKIMSSSSDDISMDKNGRVAVTSRLQVPQKEWRTGKAFRCEVSDGTLNKSVKKNINICSVTPASSQKVAVFVRGPPLEQLQNKGQLTVTCVLVGAELRDFSVTWKVGDHKPPRPNVRTERAVEHGNGTETRSSFLNVSAEDWRSYKKVSCEGKHRCSNKGYEGFIRRSSDVSPPVVRIVQPSVAELFLSDGLMLTCSVSGFFPSDIIVQWEEDGQRLPSSRYVNSPLWKEGGRSYSTRSRLNVTRAEDRKSTYACVVRHESSETPVEDSIKDVFGSVTYTKPSAVLLQGSNELVCLVSGFSPASINITWFRGQTKELWSYNTSEPLLGPDGKFSIRSRLRLSQSDSLPGVVLTCRVTHGNTTLSLNISKPDTLENCNFFDHIRDADVSQDTLKQTWSVAVTFLVCFLVAVVFSVVVTLVKVK